MADSAAKTGRLLAANDGWQNCGMAGEVIAATMERINPAALKSAPQRITLPAAPAPTSKPLEAAYYPTASQVAEAAARMVKGSAEPLAKAG